MGKLFIDGNKFTLEATFEEFLYYTLGVTEDEAELRWGVNWRIAIFDHWVEIVDVTFKKKIGD